MCECNAPRHKTTSLITQQPAVSNILVQRVILTPCDIFFVTIGSRHLTVDKYTYSQTCINIQSSTILVFIYISL